MCKKLMVLVLVAVLSPAIVRGKTVVDDHFDDGAIGTNTEGIGTGFNSQVRSYGTITEADSFVTLANATNGASRLTITAKDGAGIGSGITRFEFKGVKFAQTVSGSAGLQRQVLGVKGDNTTPDVDSGYPTGFWIQLQNDSLSITNHDQPTNGVSTLFYCDGGATTATTDDVIKVLAQWKCATLDVSGAATNFTPVLNFVLDLGATGYSLSVSGDAVTTVSGSMSQTYAAAGITNQLTTGYAWAFTQTGTPSLSVAVDRIVVTEGATGPELASLPSPADGATEVLRDTSLSWKPGQYAGTHNVYLGTSFDDVNSATISSPLLVSRGQDANSYDPLGHLDFGTTYYWRIDEVNALPSTAAFTGAVWSFTTESLAYPITAKITATASSQKSTAEGPENTINSSGMAGDVADVNSKAMWMSLSTKKGGTMPAWIEYNFDKLYKLQEMWVWNYNGSSELDMGAGAKGTKIEYLSADDQWTTLGDFEFAQGIAEDGYAHNTTVPFGGVAAKAVRLTVNETWGYEFQTGLSEVRFFYLPVWAKEPKPASDSTNIDPTTVVLSWRSGREAGSHDVYVGTDANALPKVDTVTTAGYTPAVELGTQYYWRIDEVNQTTNPTTWAGDVWNFTTPDFLVVDDMEVYNATDNAIFDTWLDGYGTNTNGSQVGYGQPANNTFSETVTTHGGTRSMPFLYGRDGITTSEATRTYATAQNWKAVGIKTLTLWFYGAAQNSAVSLYAKINDTKIAYSGAAASLQRPRWNQWNIDLTTVAAAGAVAKLTIGVTGAGTGTLLIDDLRLYKDVAAVLPPVDPGTNGLVSYFNMEGGKVADSLSGVTGTLNATTFVDSATTALGKALMCTGGTTAETTQFVDLGATYWDKVVSKLSNCTFSVWTNYTGVGSVWQRLFDFGSGQNVNTYISSSGATMGVPQFAVKTGVANSGSTGTGYVETLVRGRVMSVGWHHIAGVVDNSGAYPTISIYVDGVLSGGPVAGRLPQDMTLQATPGAWQNYLGKSNWPDPYLNGAVDELRVFNRVLTSGEISYLSGDR